MAPSVEPHSKVAVSSEHMVAQISSKNGTPVKFISMPKSFSSKEAERDWCLQHLAVAFRWMGMQGYGAEGSAGHISVRDPCDPTAFFINPYGVSFSTIKVSDLVRVNEDGEIIEGGNQHAINAAGFCIHSAIHKARPDVNAAVHAHSTAGKAFSALGIPIDMFCQDACRHYNDLAVYTNFGGVVLDSEEANHIAKALGDKSCIILQNHGK